jgi:hypothetical protein
VNRIFHAQTTKVHQNLSNSLIPAHVWVSSWASSATEMGLFYGLALEKFAHPPEDLGVQRDRQMTDFGRY